MCQENVPPCSNTSCTTPPPRGPSSAVCKNGVWFVNGPYTGGLIVYGSVHISGDLSVPFDDPLIFVRLGNAFLNITGKATIRGGLTMVVTSADINTFKNMDRYSTYYSTIMVAGDASSTPGSIITGTVNSVRACDRMITVISGAGGEYQIGIRYYTTCSTWWIILLCMLPIIIGGVAGLLPLCL